MRLTVFCIFLLVCLLPLADAIKASKNGKNGKKVSRQELCKQCPELIRNSFNKICSHKRIVKMGQKQRCLRALRKNDDDASIKNRACKPLGFCGKGAKQVTCKACPAKLKKVARTFCKDAGNWIDQWICRYGIDRAPLDIFKNVCKKEKICAWDHDRWTSHMPPFDKCRICCINYRPFENVSFTRHAHHNLNFWHGLTFQNSLLL